MRNRDRWNVIAVGREGTLTVSHVLGHGTVALPSDYVRSSVRLGYAATAHGHQGDTVDVGIAIVTNATSHRCLYVGATRGREENRLLVVTDEPDTAMARDILEQVLTNDRADVPAVVQRRNLAAQGHRTPERPERARARSAEEELAHARRALDHARAHAEPYVEALQQVKASVDADEQALRSARAALAGAPNLAPPRIDAVR